MEQCTLFLIYLRLLCSVWTFPGVLYKMVGMLFGLDIIMILLIWLRLLFSFVSLVLRCIPHSSPNQPHHPSRHTLHHPSVSLVNWGWMEWDGDGDGEELMMRCSRGRVGFCQGFGQYCHPLLPWCWWQAVRQDWYLLSVSSTFYTRIVDPSSECLRLGK